MTPPPDQSATDPALQRLLDNELPVPDRQRFQPLRMGLVGIWEYDEQVFHFYGGRLILRGYNGCGKTKALEVTSPLLLDGILNARRLDPFGNAARPMRDNLLYGGHTQRISYVWTEYGRVTESGVHQYLTVGIGMHALESHKKGLRARWFFTTSKRVGGDFALYGEDRRPRHRAELEAVLDQGDVHESAKDYREALAKRLFGFSAARLGSLVDLLLTLRRPKLSEDLTVAKLSELLKYGLPPVSGLLLEDLAGKFDELAREREELQSLIRDKGSVDTFLSAYRRLARRVVRDEAGKLVAVGQDRDSTYRIRRTKERELAEARERTHLHEEKGQELALLKDRLQTRVNELRISPEMKQHGLITELQKQQTAAEQSLSKATGRHQKAIAVRDKAAGELTVEQGGLEAAQKQLATAEQTADGCVDGAPLDATHRSHREGMRRNPASTRDALMGHVQARTQVLARAARLAEDMAEAERDHGTAADVCARLLKRVDEAKENCEGHEEVLARRIRELCAFLIDWSERCRQFALTEQQLADLIAAVPALGEDAGTTLAELIAAEARHVEKAMDTTLAEQEAERRDLGAQFRKIRDERARVAAQRDPVPPAPLTPRRERTAELGDGAPLWKLLEFAPTVTDAQAARLEAALLGAGVLDAWVTRDGRTLSADSLETILLASAPCEAPTRSLADVLHPVDHPLIPATVTQQILTSIALADQDTAHTYPTRVGSDGSWQIGAVSGRTMGTVAAYIGATAREAERRRRLEVFDLELESLSERLAELDAEIMGTRRRRDDLEAERAETRHKDRDVREARWERDGVRALLKELGQEMAKAQAEQQAQREKWQAAERTLEDFARSHGIRPVALSIHHEQESLGRYASSVTDLFHAAQEHLRRSVTTRKSEEHLDEASQQLKDCTDDLTDARTVLEGAKEKLDIRRRLAGAGVQKVLADLAQATSDLGAAQVDLDNNHNLAKGMSEQIGALAEAVTVATKECSGIDIRYQRAAEDYRLLEQRGYLALASVNAIGSQGDAAAEAQAQVALSQLDGEPCDERARNQARNDADSQSRLLQAALSGPDWRPRAEYDGQLFLVTLLHNGESRTVAQAQDIMANEIHTRRGFLGDEEHELFTEVLLGRLGDHLRRRRAEAESLIARMNTLLQQVPTSSGHLLKLVWEPEPRQDQGILDALASLDGQSTEHLADDARERLIRFLVERVETARQSESGGDWRTHLREALDYRAWSRIRIRHRAGPLEKWTNLTDRKQQRGSGGEQAVALQLPLFVAAAAHYEGAGAIAPRPIYLDEAFAGIDADMRGRCMALLTRLDLDFVIASHDEWGFHEEVPKVATYQLFRHKGLPGVLTTPILWDGAEKHVLPDPALRHDATLDAGIDWDDEEDLLDEEFPDDGDSSFGDDTLTRDEEVEEGVDEED
ncbi:TIGR02680 family protein [Streptomyces profundus]|uniref:TIGR02680 family protein n=1 Tax=Streptomyces profundus TaxID=2867410 RepID=UPI001D164706|nr:TIGR02680 family protein [Streptomyces sp. MA3_2.13]